MKTFEKKSFPRMAKDFQKMNEKGTLSFDNAVQRNFVWNNTAKDNRMSMLVDTMLRGFCIPPMYCVQTVDENGNKCYDFIDGKQRTTTIIKFLNDEFELVGIPTFEDEDGKEVDLNGKKFSELPEDYQDAFKTYSLTVYYYEDMAEDDVEEMFSRLNNGKGLTAIEVTRVKSKSFEIIKKLADNELFADALSEKAIKSYTNEDIVIKSYIMLYENKKSLDTKDVRPIMQNAEITAEQKAEMENIFAMIKNVHSAILENGNDKKLSKKVAKRIYTRTHMISLVPMIQKAMLDGRTEIDIATWLLEFFAGGKGATVSPKYNNTCSGGANHEQSVITRLSEMINSYVEFFKEYVPQIETEMIEVDDVEEKETEETEEELDEKVLETV